MLTGTSIIAIPVFGIATAGPVGAQTVGASDSGTVPSPGQKPSEAVIGRANAYTQWDAHEFDKNLKRLESKRRRTSARVFELTQVIADSGDPENFSAARHTGLTSALEFASSDLKAVNARLEELYKFIHEENPDIAAELQANEPLAQYAQQLINRQSAQQTNEAQLRDQLRESQLEVERAQQALIAQKAEAEETLRAEIARINTRMRQQAQEMRLEREIAVARLQTQLEQEREAQAADENQLIAEREIAAGRNEALLEDTATLLLSEQDLKRSQATLAERFKTTQRVLSNEIEQLNQELTTLRATSGMQAGLIATAHAAEISRLRNQLEAERASHRAIIERKSADIAAAKAEIQSLLDKTSTLEMRKTTLERSRRATIQRSSKTARKLNSQIAGLKLEVQTQASAHEKAFELERVRMRSILESTEAMYNLKVQSLSAQLRSNRIELGGLRTQTEQLNDSHQVAYNKLSRINAAYALTSEERDHLAQGVARLALKVAQQSNTVLTQAKQLEAQAENLEATKQRMLSRERQYDAVKASLALSLVSGACDQGEVDLKPLSELSVTDLAQQLRACWELASNR